MTGSSDNSLGSRVESHQTKFPRWARATWSRNGNAVERERGRAVGVLPTVRGSSQWCQRAQPWCSRCWRYWKNLVNVFNRTDHRNYFADESTPPAESNDTPEQLTNKLPWVPKIRRKDIEVFLNTSRSKFIGYILKDDHNTLAGLPQPIKEGFFTLKKVRKCAQCFATSNS